MFSRVFQWAGRLRPKAVFAPIPKQEGMKSRADKWHGASPCLGDATSEAKIILKLAIWLMARGARNCTIGTKAGIEEKRLAQSCRQGIVCDKV